MTGWDAFTAALADDLHRLDDGDTVILSYGQRYVQFTQTAPVLYADTSDGDEARLTSLGWLAPEPDLGLLNRWIEMQWPPRPADSRRLAELVVGTLRDVHGASGPDVLTYKSFNSRTGTDPQLRALAGVERSEN